jgi:hypothetical protein
LKCAGQDVNRLFKPATAMIAREEGVFGRLLRLVPRVVSHSGYHIRARWILVIERKRGRGKGEKSIAKGKNMIQYRYNACVTLGIDCGECGDDRNKPRE